MKQRFSSLDIKVIAHELSAAITSLRVSNIYDLSSRIFLFKFAASSRKEQFVIDSGFRCHLSSYARTTAATPSAFVTRLRKFLRSRRVTKVAQVGTDRILEFQFSDGQYHLFLEFYAGGNIVLTDNELKVIAVQRIVTEGAPHEHLRVGAEYNLSERQNINGVPGMTRERLRDGLQRYVNRQAAGQQSTNKKLKKKAGDTLRKALAASINEYPPMLLDHALRQVGFDITLQPEDVLKSDDALDKLLLAMEEARKLMEEVMSKDTASGYIFGKPATGREPQTEKGEEDGSGNNVTVMYEDFHPFKPKHLAEDPAIRTLEFEGFNRTVDEFFSSIEGQKLESRLAEKEANARKKIEHAKQDQEKRLGGLQQVQEVNIRKAQAIEANLERVQEAMAAVNGLIAQGMDWDEVEKLVELEQRRGNPVAEVIKLPLKLQENTVTLRLAEWDVDGEEDEIDEGYMSTDADPSDSEEEEVSATSKKKPAPTEAKGDKRLQVDIDLSLSPWSNARDYYDQKRTAASKEEKTMQASARALKSTTRKVEADLKRALKQEKQTLRPVRKVFWFEKFTYFISSDGYLVLGARDAQQSDLLHKRHLKTGDAWVHADLDGAMPCIVKNRTASADAPVPPGTLSQAGNLCVATSTAWDSKAVMSAWWVPPPQVSKKARTGDYMQPGRFEITGDKNFLPPAQLLLGFAVLFQISEQSKARHTKHRVQDDASANQATQPEQVNDDSNRAEDEDEGTDEQVSSEEDGEDDEKGLEPENEYEQAVDGAAPGPQSEGEVERHDEEDAEDVPYSNPLQSGQAFSGRGGEDATSANGDADQAESDADEDEEKQHEEDADGEISKDGPANDAGGKLKGPIPVRGKRGKKKKIAQKYAEQDEEDRAEALRLLGSAAGQQKQKDEVAAKAEREKEQAAQRQRRREQHQKAQKRKAQREDEEGGEDDEEENVNFNVDLDTLVGTPLPGDEILEAVPICAPWGALGRYKYKAKLQPGNEKKGKAVRGILSKWGSDGANKRNVDEKAEDVERIWPKEMELIKAWKEAEIFGVVPVSKVRVMISGASSSGGGKGGGNKKSKKPSGRGSKKQR